MNGLKKVSELDIVTATSSDYVPVIVPDGGGGFTNGRALFPIAPASTNIYNSDGTLTGNRDVDLDTFNLLFSNSLGDILKLNTDRSIQVSKEAGFNGLAPATGYGVYSTGSISGVRGEGFYGLLAVGNNTGLYSVCDSGFAIDAITTTGIGIRTNAPTNASFQGNGTGYFEDYGLGAGINSSSLFQLNSTTKGFLPPRMTTAQINAIALPVEGLTIYNIDRDRIETYDSSRSVFIGEAMSYAVQSTSSSPADGTIGYFGAYPKGLVTTDNISKVYIQKSGVIRRANINSYSGTAGSNENWSLYIRVNNTTDYLVETIGSATNERTFDNNALNIPVVEGDFFEIKLVNPTWVTNPATTTFGGNIIVE